MTNAEPAPALSAALDAAALAEIVWNDAGLIPVIAQERASGRVLMVAWMNRAALAETLRRGVMVYWSRSRRRLWRKGETSGNEQRLLALRLDCDGDVLLAEVEQRGDGVACHTGRHSCFFRTLDDGGWTPDQRAPGAGVDATLNELAALLEARKSADPDSSYVARLYADAPDAILKKLGEEALETVLASKSGQTQNIVYETADLWFHSLVMLAHHGLSHRDVIAELRRRFGRSGLAEKAARDAARSDAAGSAATTSTPNRTDAAG